MAKTNRNQIIYKTIADTMANKELTDWSDIVDEVGKKLTVKNWMEVRNVLQWMIDEREIARTADINKEQYRKVSNGEA